jgi:hypothetical protein
MFDEGLDRLLPSSSPSAPVAGVVVAAGVGGSSYDFQQAYNDSISCTISRTIGNWTFRDAKNVIGSVVPLGAVEIGGFGAMLAGGSPDRGLEGIEVDPIMLLLAGVRPVPLKLAVEGDRLPGGCPLKDCPRIRLRSGSPVSPFTVKMAFGANDGRADC